MHVEHRDPAAGPGRPVAREGLEHAGAGPRDAVGAAAAPAHRRRPRLTRLLRWSGASGPDLRRGCPPTSGPRARPSTSTASTAGRRRTGNVAAAARRTRCSTSSSPTTPRRRAGCAAGIPGRASTWSPRPTGRRRTPAGRWYATDADGVVRLDVPAFVGERGDTVRFVRRLLRGDGVPAGVHRLLRAARVGDGLPRRAARGTRSRCGWARPARTPSSRRTPSGARTSTRSGSSPRPPSHATGCSPPGRRSPSWSSPAACTRPWTSTSGPTSSARPPPASSWPTASSWPPRCASWTCAPRPTTCAAHGYEPVAIETPAGKAEYAAAQRGFAERGAVLRARLIEVCDRLL